MFEYITSGVNMYTNLKIVICLHIFSAICFSSVAWNGIWRARTEVQASFSFVMSAYFSIALVFSCYVRIKIRPAVLLKWLCRPSKS
jgi:hypothetical protein